MENKIYTYRANLEKERQRLEQEKKIRKEDKNLLKEYIDFILSIGLSEARIYKLSCELRYICIWLYKLNIKKGLKDIDKKDIISLVSHIKTLNKAESTKNDYISIIKQFFKWFKDEDERLFSKDLNIRNTAFKLYKYLEKDLRLNHKREQADPNEVLDNEDIIKVVDKCKTPMEKAFIYLLFETGCRAGEFLNIRIGDIIFKNDYAEVHIPKGKTGKRVIYVLNSIPYLVKYLDCHEFKEDKNSLLWVSKSNRFKGKPLRYYGAKRLIQRNFKRAKINKRYNLHWFRHSRATLLAPKVPQSLLCKYMGWSLGSDMVKVYTHLSNKQLEDTFLTINGLKKPSNEDNNQPIKCICGSLNSSHERYCSKCYKPLKVEIAIQDDEIKKNELDNTIKLMVKMLQNPEVLKKFEEFKSL